MGRIDRPDDSSDGDPEGDKPDEQSDTPKGPADGSTPDGIHEPDRIDRRKVTPVQRDFNQRMQNEPLSSENVPYSINWKTGKATDRVPPAGSTPGDTVDETDDETADEVREDASEKASDEGADAAPDEARDERLDETTDQKPDDKTDRPAFLDTPLADTRPYDRYGGLTRPNPHDQRALEIRIPRDQNGQPEKFPSLNKGYWTRYINDGGPRTDRLRGNNCLDCSLAAIATFHGKPTVSAPRTADKARGGHIDTAKGELGGMERAEAWLGQPYTKQGVSDDAFAKIEQKLLDGGPGSAAAIVHAWNPKEGLDGAHAWNAFNDGGKIVWYDPQISVKGDQPIHRGSEVTNVWAICIDKDGKGL